MKVLVDVQRRGVDERKRWRMEARGNEWRGMREVGMQMSTELIGDLA